MFKFLEVSTWQCSLLHTPLHTWLFVWRNPVRSRDGGSSYLYNWRLNRWWQCFCFGKDQGVEGSGSSTQGWLIFHRQSLLMMEVRKRVWIISWRSLAFFRVNAKGLSFLEHSTCTAGKESLDWVASGQRAQMEQEGWVTSVSCQVFLRNPVAFSPALSSNLQRHCKRCRLALEHHSWYTGIHRVFRTQRQSLGSISSSWWKSVESPDDKPVRLRILTEVKKKSGIQATTPGCRYCTEMKGSLGLTTEIL